MGLNISTETMMKIVIVALALAAVCVNADELKDLSSADVNAPVQEASLDKTSVETKKSDLGESTGNAFAGALLTSGSFTMMASNSYEEEEELGEGEGTGNAFAGALLTSGSFTMMASAGY